VSIQRKSKPLLAQVFALDCSEMVLLICPENILAVVLQNLACILCFSAVESSIVLHFFAVLLQELLPFICEQYCIVYLQNTRLIDFIEPASSLPYSKLEPILQIRRDSAFCTRLLYLNFLKRCEKFCMHWFPWDYIHTSESGKCEPNTVSLV
jgi:hypothetical protein